MTVKKTIVLFLFVFFNILLNSCSDKDVEPDKSSQKDVLAFLFKSLNPEAMGTIDDSKKEIHIVVPKGTELTKLSPSITISDKATISPKSEEVVDFTKDVVYTVTAEDGSKQTYTAFVSFAKSGEKSIEKFSFEDFKPVVNGTVNHAEGSVMVILPPHTDVTKLKPTIQVSSAATISPESNVITNFSAPVEYIVTAEDGTKKIYKITVSVQKSSEKSIEKFSFEDFNPAIEGTITYHNSEIELIVPANTDVTKLKPTIVISKGATISPTSNVVTNFSAPVEYKVTAEDGSYRVFTVKVTVNNGQLFKNQPVQGFVNKGLEFIPKVTLWDNSVWDETTITLFEDDTKNCSNRFTSSNTKVSFTIPILKTGYQKGKGPYFHVKNNDGTSSSSYFNCEVEILSITETTITGKVKGGYLEDGKYIEGNFTATYCK